MEGGQDGVGQVSLKISVFGTKASIPSSSQFHQAIRRTSASAPRQARQQSKQPPEKTRLPATMTYPRPIDLAQANGAYTLYYIEPLSQAHMNTNNMPNPPL